MSQLTDLVRRIDVHGSDRRARVAELRSFYEQAIATFDHLLGRLPRPTLDENSRRRWLDEPYAALRTYAAAEGLW